MNNLLAEMELGLTGKKVGLTTGSSVLDRMLLGIRKGASIVVAAKEKVGKSKWTRYHFIVQPYLKEVLKNNKRVKWILFTLEEPRVKVEADVTSALIKHFYNKTVTRATILGEDLDQDGKPKLITREQQDLVRLVYHEHIIPLFGEHDPDTGLQIKKGLITTHEVPMSPTEYKDVLIKYAERYGTPIYKEVTRKKGGKTLVESREILNFTPQDDTTCIVIVDDYRLMKADKGGSSEEKAIVDAAIKTEVELTQRLKWFFFCGIIHLNRENTDYKRIETIGANRYFPDASLIFGTSSAAQRKHAVVTLYNPEETVLDSPLHFNYTLPGDGTYRSCHLVTSRDVVFPQHARATFDGGTITFEEYEKISI